MAFEKGNKHGKGRPKGSKDKLTRDIKQRIVEVWNKLEEKEGVSLEEIAQKNPEWFYKNFVKPMIPKDVIVAGDEDKPLITEIKVKLVKS
jgi:hypothetical protein